MDKRERKIYDLIKKHNDIHVSKILSLARMKRPTVIKVLKRLEEKRKVTYVKRQNRNHYYVMRKGQKNFEELEQNITKEMDHFEFQINKIIEIFESRKDSLSVGLLIECTQMIIDWFGILKVYKSGYNEKQIPNRWKMIEFRLQKMFSKLMQDYQGILRPSMLSILAINYGLRESKLDRTIKQLSIEDQKEKKLE